jgi:hypothetical protein
VKAFKALAGTVGFVGFLIGGISVALCARHYQKLAQLMPNGKGGFMTFGNGYYIAAVFILMSVVWFLMARKYWRLVLSEQRQSE